MTLSVRRFVFNYINGNITFHVAFVAIQKNNPMDLKKPEQTNSASGNQQKDCTTRRTILTIKGSQ